MGSDNHIIGDGNFLRGGVDSLAKYRQIEPLVDTATNAKFKHSRASGLSSSKLEEELENLSKPKNGEMIPELRKRNTELLEVVKPEGATIAHENRLDLGKMIANSATSTVFDAAGNEHRKHPFVIKYQINCDPSAPHDLLREYHFLKAVEPLGIAPKALMISGGSYALEKLFEFENGQVVGSKNQKLMFDFNEPIWKNIHDGLPICVGGEVRFMLMEKVGESIGGWTSFFDFKRSSRRCKNVGNY
jgi:hypothetical protein